MITSVLPEATRVQPARESPTRAAGLPLIKTDVLPRAMGAVCGGQNLPPGRRWVVEVSPCLAAPRPLMNTSLEAVAMV